jgi:DNA-binding PadR family transcriptional regulator
VGLLQLAFRHRYTYTHVYRALAPHTRLEMSLKLAVLGLLVERRGYGYDLARRFEDRVGSGWQLNEGAIYVALDNLQREGLVEHTSDAAAGLGKRRTHRGAPRVMYEATGKGAAEFEAWMVSPSLRAPVREELHLKLALSREHHLPRLIEITVDQEQVCLTRLERYAGQVHFEDLVRTVEPWEAISAVMVRDAEIAYLQATIEWLRRIREAMEWLHEQPKTSLRRA